MDLGSGNHHRFHGRIREFEHAVDQFFFGLIENPLGGALANQRFDFVDGNEARALVFAATEEPQHQVARRGQYFHENCTDARKEFDRPSDETSDLLRIPQRKGFRDQLTQDEG